MAEYQKSFDAITHVDLQTVGFTSQLDEYLTLNGVTRDEVVAELERFQDITLAVAIGNIKGTKQMKEEGAVQAGSAEHAALSAQQDAQAAEASTQAPQAEETAPVAPEASEVASEGPKAEPEAPAAPQATEAQPEAQAVDAES